MAFETLSARSSQAPSHRKACGRFICLVLLMALQMAVASLLSPVAAFAQESFQEPRKVVQIPSPGTGEVLWVASDGTYEDYLTPTLDSFDQEYAGQVRIPSATIASRMGACFANTSALPIYTKITLRLYTDDFSKPADDPFVGFYNWFTFPGGQEKCVSFSGSFAVPQAFWVSVVYDSFVSGDLKLLADTNGFGDQLVNRQGSYGFWSDVWGVNGAALFVGLPVSGSVTDECVNDLENGVVCLRDGRFEFTGTWTGFGNPAVTQPLIWTPVENINATAGFQNNPSGIQIVMRVADGCSISGTWWIWLGGFTDAGWNITVRDTETGISKTFNRTRSGGNFPTTLRDMETFTCD